MHLLFSIRQRLNPIRMTLDTLIIGAGACVALLPFLGFPVRWDMALLFLIGLFIIGLGIAVRRKRGAEETMRRHKAATFAESAPHQAASASLHEAPQALE